MILNKTTKKKEDRIFLIVGLIMATSEILKQLLLTFVVNGGSYLLWNFPWQLCSIPMYVSILVFIVGLAGKMKLREGLITFLSDFGLMSGIAAFCDTSGMQYTLFVLTLHSYLWHLVLIGLGIYAGTRKRKTGILSFISPVIIYLLAAGVAEIINLSLNPYGLINMFYINPRYVFSQVVIRDLDGILPNNVVIIIYILASVLGAFLFHLGWLLLYRLKTHLKKSTRV